MVLDSLNVYQILSPEYRSMELMGEVILSYVHLAGFGLYFDCGLDSRVSNMCLPKNKSCMSDTHRRSIFSALFGTTDETVIILNRMTTDCYDIEHSPNL